jgi:integrase
MWLAEAVGNRGPELVGPEDIKRALMRWQGNSRIHAHAVYRSFFKWAMTEHIRTNNPADMVRATRRREPEVGRLTRSEVVELLAASQERRRDRWVAHLGVCAGLRSQELRGLQGRHFARTGWVWVDRAIGKGGKERWVPILTDLVPIVDEITTLVGIDEYVIPGRRTLDPPFNTVQRDDPGKPSAASSIYRQVVTLGQRAGLPTKVTPHVLRRAFAEHVARLAGLRVAQALLGHASVETTTLYTEVPTLDELAISVRGFSFYDVANLPFSRQIREAANTDGRPQ